MKMESAIKWEYNTLINELTNGMEQAKQLRLHLHSSSPSGSTQDLLLQRILASYEKALWILKWSGPVGQSQAFTPASGPPESSVSVDGSPKSEEMNKSFRDYQDQREASKKRKLLPTWTEQVRVNSENGLAGPADDGHSWRKYGQKDILGAKYPRSYYRCTYRLVQNCWATKQVQRSDDDPSIFEITYKGTHTCNQVTDTAPAPGSPQKQPKQANSQKHQSQEHNQMLQNLRANLRVETENLGNKEIPAHFSFPSTFGGFQSEDHIIQYSELVNDGHVGGYSPLFLSPATSGSNYFSATPYEMTSFGGTHNLQASESDIAEIISANASTTNSPIGGVEFLIDPVDLDPNFPFDTPGFFT